MDYFFVSQGKTSIPGVDDAEELELTDVRFRDKVFLHFFFFFGINNQKVV